MAVLEDGGVSEDVLFINSPGSSERVDVDLVELYVVVTDRKGRPLRDLGETQFTVLEEGRPQPLSNFGDAGDLPITVGLVIDSSASMFVKLPEVQAAAASYIYGLTTRKDRDLRQEGKSESDRLGPCDFGSVTRGRFVHLVPSTSNCVRRPPRLRPRFGLPE